jgi:hypothetical protein
MFLYQASKNWNVALKLGWSGAIPCMSRMPTNVYGQRCTYLPKIVNRRLGQFICYRNKNIGNAVGVFVTVLCRYLYRGQRTTPTFGGVVLAAFTSGRVFQAVLTPVLLLCNNCTMAYIFLSGNLAVIQTVKVVQAQSPLLYFSQFTNGFM